ncbi:MAG: hypothetical protein R3275_11725 [Saprospiraceae bacterium]|nr:hypothetical protein [Saprospiraceae bacterium]
MNEKAYIALNSTILYLIAFLITTMVHEGAHAIVGLYFGSDPVLHHNYVEHFSKQGLPTIQLCAIALAGPLISLTQGIIAGRAFLRSSRSGLLHLFLIWLSVLGFNNFLGYLMTGPIFQMGDVGKFYALVNLPLVYQILFAVTGAALLLYIAYRMTKPFLEFSYKREWVNDGPSRKNFNFHTIILPWVLGSVVMTILYLPPVALISIIYPVMSGFVFIFPWQNADTIEHIELSSDSSAGRPSPPLVLTLFVLILVFKFILAPGIELY